MCEFWGSPQICIRECRLLCVEKFPSVRSLPTTSIFNLIQSSDIFTSSFPSSFFAFLYYLRLEYTDIQKLSDENYLYFPSLRNLLRSLFSRSPALLIADMPSIRSVFAGLAFTTFSLIQTNSAFPCGPPEPTLPVNGGTSPFISIPTHNKPTNPLFRPCRTRRPISQYRTTLRGYRPWRPKLQLHSSRSCTRPHRRSRKLIW